MTNSQDPASTTTPINVNGKKAEPSLAMRALGATTTSGVDTHRVISVGIFALAIVLIVQNSSSTELHFLFFSFQAPVWVMCVTTLLLGGVAWELFKRGRRRRATAEQAAGQM